MHINTRFQHKILIVDDKQDHLINLIRAVELLRHIPVPVLVDSSTTIDEIIEEVRVHGIRLALLDYRLISFTGEDIAKKLHSGVMVISTSSLPEAVTYTEFHISGKDICLRIPDLAEEIKGLLVGEPIGEEELVLAAS